MENIQLQVDEKSVSKVYRQAGESTLVSLVIDGKTIPVLFQAYDPDPVSERPLHIDFFAVNMKEEVEAQVTIRLEGEAPIVKEGAILVTAQHEVTVRCLPAHLPHDLPLDLSSLTEFGAVLTVSNLNVPDKVTIIDAPESVLVIAQQPREEEPEEVPATPEAGAEGAPAAEGAEGAPPAAEGAKNEKDGE